MKETKEDVRHMSDARLKQALEARLTLLQKQEKWTVGAMDSCVALILVCGVAAALTASAALCFGPPAAFVSALIVDAVGTRLREKNLPGLRELSEESASRARAAKPNAGAAFATLVLTQLFAAIAPAKPKHSPKIPKLLPIKITPVTNWN